jgi:hypothetical protein
MSAPDKTSADGLEFRRDGADLSFTWPRYQLTATLRRIRERADGLAGELEIAHAIAGRIFWGYVTLGSVTARERIAAKLRREIPTTDGGPHWTVLVDRLCYLATQEFRDDGAFVRVGTMDDASSDTDEYLIPPLLLTGNLNTLYATSGTGKGYLAAAIALHMDGVPVLPLPLPETPAPTLYLDWEWGPDELNRRLRALCRGAGSPHHAVLYRRMAGALADHADTLRREIARQGIRLMIIDSAQIACGQVDGADPAAAFLRLCAAVRSFGVTTLLVDHPAKGVERGEETPYGTRYKLALCRNIWKAHKSHGTESELHVGLWHDNNSNTPHHAPLGLRLVFDRESWPAGRLRSLRIVREDVRDVEGFADLLTDWERIERALLHQPLHVKDLVDATALSENAVRARLSEKRRKGLVARLEDGRWAAVDRGRQE